MTDSELCLAVAKLDGYIPTNIPYILAKLGLNGVWDDLIDIRFVSTQYNPLANTKLCFDLLVKYRVELYYNKNKWHARKLNVPYYVSKNTVEKAICLAILQEVAIT